MTVENSKIFIIEDEQDIAELILFNLKVLGHQAQHFSSCEQTLEKLTCEKPSLILLDLMLPGMGGLEFCQILRSNPEMDGVKIIIVSAKGTESDIVKGLELGADDYLSKPFSPKILVARVQAVLRRDQLKIQDSEWVHLGPIKVSKGKREAWLAGGKLDLTKFEFQILLTLLKKPGWVFTRTQLVDSIHGESYAVTDRSIDFQMVGLRKKLAPHGDLIETVRGIGYRVREI